MYSSIAARSVRIPLMSAEYQRWIRYVLPSGKTVGWSFTDWVRPNGLFSTWTKASCVSVNSVDPSPPVVCVVPANVNFSPATAGTDCTLKIERDVW